MAKKRSASYRAARARRRGLRWAHKFAMRHPGETADRYLKEAQAAFNPQSPSCPGIRSGL